MIYLVDAYPQVQCHVYWGTKVWNIDINFVVFKKTNKEIKEKTYV